MTAGHVEETDQSVVARAGSAIVRATVPRLRQHGLSFARDGAIIALSYSFAEGLRFDGPIPEDSFNLLLLALPVVIAVYLIVEYGLGIHRYLWQYAGMPDMRALLDACIVATVIVGIADLIIPGVRPLPMSVVPAGGLFSLAGLLVVRLWRRLFISRRPAPTVATSRVLIVGAGQGGQLAAAELLANRGSQQFPVGFLDDDPAKAQKRIHGLPVLGTIEELRHVVLEYQIDTVAVAIPSASTRELDRILALAQPTNARIQILSDRAEMLTRQGLAGLRDIRLDDLLDRVPLNSPLDNTVVRDCIENRTVLVTGAAGSIGSELCRQIMRLSPGVLLALDNNESRLFALERELEMLPHAHLLRPVLADVADESGVERVFRDYRPDIVFHAAAYKHVPMLEAHPAEAVHVNIVGTANLCRAARVHGCDRFVFISTDKAVQPVNILGYSKRIGELLVHAHDSDSTTFCSVRFGNVIGSRGSALPEFIRQIDAGGPVTVTHPDVERYFMTIPEAVSLVIQAGALASGGELFMLDMGQPVKIAALARRIIRLRGLRPGKDIRITYTGLRPGEKLTEDLTYAGEQRRLLPDLPIFAVTDDIRASLDTLSQSIELLKMASIRVDMDMLRTLIEAMARQGDVRDLITEVERFHVVG